MAQPKVDPASAVTAPTTNTLKRDRVEKEDDSSDEDMLATMKRAKLLSKKPINVRESLSASISILEEDIASKKAALAIQEEALIRVAKACLATLDASPGLPEEQTATNIPKPSLPESAEDQPIEGPLPLCANGAKIPTVAGEGPHLSSESQEGIAANNRPAVSDSTYVIDLVSEDDESEDEVDGEVHAEAGEAVKDNQLAAIVQPYPYSLPEREPNLREITEQISRFAILPSPKLPTGLIECFVVENFDQDVYFDKAGPHAHLYIDKKVVPRCQSLLEELKELEFNGLLPSDVFLDPTGYKLEFAKSSDRNASPSVAHTHHAFKACQSMSLRSYSLKNAVFYPGFYKAPKIKNTNYTSDRT